MYIKKILEYNYNYAEYLVSDGECDLKCMCVSVPLPNNKEPYVGMQVIEIHPFCVHGITIIKITNDEYKNYKIIDSTNDYFKYTLRGRLIDSKRGIVEVFGFIISLEFEYPEGLCDDLYDGDFIEFVVDRLDCRII